MATAVPAQAISTRGDALTVSAVALLAWMLASMSHEGIGHGVAALVISVAGGNAGLLWLQHYAPKGTVPTREAAGVGRSYLWIGVAAALALAFIFVLGRGITLHR
jgi:hypothetical protein